MLRCQSPCLASLSSLLLENSITHTPMFNRVVSHARTLCTCDMLYYPRSPGLRAELALSTFRFAWRGEGSETRVMPHTQNQEHIHTRTRKWHPSCRERTSGSSAHSNAWPVPEFPGTLPTSCTFAGCSLSLEYSYLDPGMTHGGTVYQVVTNMPYL